MRSRPSFLDRHKKPVENPKKKSHDAKPTLSSAPKHVMDETEFNYEYSQFTADLPITQEVRDNLKYLYELYSRVCQHGGLVQAAANNKLPKIIHEMSIKFPEMSSLTPENVLEHYIKFYLFSFEIVLKMVKKIDNDRLVGFMLPKFIEGAELRHILADETEGIRLFEEDITLLCSLSQQLQLKSDIFSLQNMGLNCKSETIKVFVQDIDQLQLEGWENAQQYQNTQISHSMLGFEKFKDFVTGAADIQNLMQHQQTIQLPFNEYLQYFKSYPHQTSEQRNQILKLRYFSNNLNCEKVLYGYQFDPKQQIYGDEIYDKIRGTFLQNKQKYDFLAYADEDILGVTIPIFSMRVFGCWSGGKLQPYGMAKVDINFGPDQVQWFCTSSQNTQKFYNTFKTEYAINIEKLQGEWFENLDWFIQRKIPIKKVIQSKGDGIIIGSGCLSWHKSKGKSFHCSWNIMPKSQKQMVAISNRCSKLKQCSLLSFSRQSSVPIKSILLRTLNHQQYEFPLKKSSPVSRQALKKKQPRISSTSFVILRQCLKKWYSQQQKYLNQMIIRQELNDINYRVCHLFDGESKCTYCQTEILNYFALSNGLSCMECAAKKLVNKKLVQLDEKSIFCKYDPYWMYQLIYYGDCRNTENGDADQVYPQIQEMCMGEFIGNVHRCNKIGKCTTKQPPEMIQDDKQWQTYISNTVSQQELRYGSRHQSIVLPFILKKIHNLDANQQQTNPRFKHCDTQTILSLISTNKEPDFQIGPLLDIQSAKCQQRRQSNSLKLAEDNQQSKVSAASKIRKKKRYQENQSEMDVSDCSEEVTKTTLFDQAIRKKQQENNPNLTYTVRPIAKQRDPLCKIQGSRYEDPQRYKGNQQKTSGGGRLNYKEQKSYSGFKQTNMQRDSEERKRRDQSRYKKQYEKRQYNYTKYQNQNGEKKYRGQNFDKFQYKTKDRRRENYC